MRPYLYQFAMSICPREFLRLSPPAGRRRRSSVCGPTLRRTRQCPPPRIASIVLTPLAGRPMPNDLLLGLLRLNRYADGPRLFRASTLGGGPPQGRMANCEPCALAHCDSDRLLEPLRPQTRIKSLADHLHIVCAVRYDLSVRSSSGPSPAYAVGGDLAGLGSLDATYPPAPLFGNAPDLPLPSMGVERRTTCHATPASASAARLPNENSVAKESPPSSRSGPTPNAARP
jgi:hypothetical protein